MGYPLEIHGIPGEIHGNPGENPWKSRGNLLEIRIFCCVIIGFLSVAPGKFCSLNSLNQFCDPFFSQVVWFDGDVLPFWGSYSACVSDDLLRQKRGWAGGHTRCWWIAFNP